MGLLEQEIKELRKLNKEFAAGKVSMDSLNGQVAVYSQIEKRAKLMLQAQSIAAKFGKTTFNRISKTNLVGDGSCVDIEDVSNETVHCPDQEKVISRDECLEFSGSSNNCENCNSCEHFKQTRHILLGDGNKL